jgi:Methyltransferase domain
MMAMQKKTPKAPMAESSARPSGAHGLDKQYWDTNYADPQEMDTIGNARDHVRYMQALFNLEQIDVSSVVDFGHGTGHLLHAVMKGFKPYEVLGLEPSPWAYEQSLKRVQEISPNMRLKLVKTDILSWCRKNVDTKKFYDLGICTSVLQYLSDAEITEAIPTIANHVKYLYLTVPTEHEYQRLWEEHKFKDDYALRRTREDYLKHLQKDFTFVSNRLLESKRFFNEHNTDFRELVFRF